jgi:hypothetical protein
VVAVAQKIKNISLTGSISLASVSKDSDLVISMPSTRMHSQNTRQSQLATAAWCVLRGRSFDHIRYASVSGKSLKLANPETET